MPIVSEELPSSRQRDQGLKCIDVGASTRKARKVCDSPVGSFQRMIESLSRMCSLDNFLSFARFFVPTLVAFASGFLGHYLVVLGLKLSGHSSGSDKSARWIGYLERILVTTFVLAGLSKESVFIFAVKAAVIGLRVPSDLKPDQKKKNAEYMLIGTMLSYLVALAFGFAGLRLIN